MYHKVNDPTPNPTTVPSGSSRSRWRCSASSATSLSSLEQVRAHYVGRSLSPPGAVLITFDDGYRDNLVNALPILQEHGYPAVIFVPIGFLDGDRPLPHEEALRALGVLNETVDWDELAELEAGGMRVESHGIGHRPVSELEPADAAREIALSKLRLEDRLGRPVEAYAFVKGSLADYRPEHVSLVQQAGYSLGFTSVSGANGPTTDRYSLRRYNVEPYPRAHVRARPRRRLRPHLGEGHGSRDVRAARVQQGARHRHAVSFASVRYTPEWRQSLVALLARVGYDAADRRGVRLVVRPQPGRRGHRVARRRRGRGRRRGRDELLQDTLDGVETRLAIPVNVATDSRYRGQGVFSTLEARTRRQRRPPALRSP